MIGRGKLREKLSSFSIDPKEFEQTVEQFIEFVEPSKISGADKKKLVIKKIEQWVDDKIALRGFWEFLSDIAIRVVMIFLSSWVESIFLRWKEKNKPQADTIENLIGGVAERLEKPVASKRSKEK